MHEHLSSQKLLAALWGTEKFRRKRPVDKYIEALKAAGCQDFKRGVPTVQAVSSLIRLRNELVHYTPVWIETKPGTHKVADALRGRFGTNPFALPGQPLFPMGFASFACAVWAIKSSVKFVDSFFDRFGA